MKDYNNKYINFSAVKPLFIKKSLDKKITKVQISSEALPLVKNFLDCSVKTSVRRAVSSIPRITRGENKGKLKRKTIQTKDLFTSSKPKYETKYIRSSKLNEVLIDEKTGAKLRIAGDAKNGLLRQIDDFIEVDVRDFISYTMPGKMVQRPKFGFNEKILTRTRIQPYDFREYDFKVCNWKPRKF